MLIIPHADMSNRGSLNRTARAFRNHGAHVEVMDCPPKDLDLPKNLAKLDGVNVIFFSGGSPTALVNALQGTQFLERIRELHQAGATICGTSEGATVLSKIMLAGDGNHKVPKGKDPETFGVIEVGNVDLADGFGFMPEAIIDPHFVVRKRMNRLLSAMQDRPDLLGLGIDENTAIDVDLNNGTFEVLGARSVIVVKPLYKRGETPRFEVMQLRKGHTYEYRSE